MLIDTHCHLNFKAYADDRDAVLARALADDTWVINVGTQYISSRRAVDMADAYQKGVYAIIGLHPIHIHEQDVDEPEQGIDFHAGGEGFALEKFKNLAQHEKVVGIGEMGLDYFHMPAGIDPEEVKADQKVVFEKGLELARSLDLPVTVHTRPSKGKFDAYDDVLEVLSKNNFSNAVIHCFSGTREQAYNFLDYGCTLSVTGIVTFKNARDLHDLVKEIPLEKMFIETDAPFLTPEPYRGQRNEPLYVRYVAQKIAEIKGISFTEVAEVTTARAREFFRI